MSTNGTGFTVLHSFTNASGGQSPFAALTLSGSTLYGTTWAGGASTNSIGTVFSMSTNGTGFTVLHSFTNASDGQFLQAGINLAGSTLYGTASRGGSLKYGTVFALNLSSTNSGGTNSVTNTNTGTNSLADDPNFVAELVSNPYFLSSLAYEITNTPGGYGMLQQGPQGIQGSVGSQGSVGPAGATGPQGPIGLTGTQGPIGLTGPAGPQGPIGLTGPQGPAGTNGMDGPQGPAGQLIPDSVLTNTSFLSSLATNQVFLSALASNPAFLNAVANNPTSPFVTGNRAIQTITFPAIPVKKIAVTKTVTLKATSSANLTPISYTSDNASVALVSNNVLLIEGTGTARIKATQAGDENYNPVTAIQSLIVH